MIMHETGKSHHNKNGDQWSAIANEVVITYSYKVIMYLLQWQGFCVSYSSVQV